MATKVTSAARFATTRWSLIVAAQNPKDRRRAFEALCVQYWCPLYAFVRRRGVPPPDAADLTQGFILALFATDPMSRVSPERGRFRSWLLGALKHFLANEQDRANALKRGGGEAELSLDFAAAEGRYAAEPTDGSTPEALYLRRWADALVGRAIERLRAECERGGRGPLFAALQDGLTGATESHASIASSLAMTKGAVKVASHRMRKRFRELLVEEAADTLEDRAQAEDELRALLAEVGQ